MSQFRANCWEELFIDGERNNDFVGTVDRKLCVDVLFWMWLKEIFSEAERNLTVHTTVIYRAQHRDKLRIG